MAKRTRQNQTVALVPVLGFEPEPNGGDATFHEGVPQSNPGKKRRSMDFKRIIGRGENDFGFTAQTANGTAKAGNDPGWNQEYKFTMPRAEQRGPWRKGNRSGE